MEANQIVKEDSPLHLLIDGANYKSQEGAILAYRKWRELPVMVCKRILIHACGYNRNAADLLLQMLYWVVNPEDGTTRLRHKIGEELVLVKTQYEFDLEIGINDSAFRTAQKKLKESGIVDHALTRKTGFYKGGTASHYSINFNRLNRELATASVNLVHRFGTLEGEARRPILENTFMVAQSALRLRRFIDRKRVADGTPLLLNKLIDELGDHIRSSEADDKQHLVSGFEAWRSELRSLYKCLTGSASVDGYVFERYVRSVRQRLLFADHAVGDGASIEIAISAGPGIDVRNRRLQLAILDRDARELARAYTALQRRRVVWTAWKRSCTVSKAVVDETLSHLVDVYGDIGPEIMLTAVSNVTGSPPNGIDGEPMLKSLRSLTADEVDNVRRTLSFDTFRPHRLDARSLERMLSEMYSQELNLKTMPYVLAEAAALEPDGDAFRLYHKIKQTVMSEGRFDSRLMIKALVDTAAEGGDLEHLQTAVKSLTETAEPVSSD